MKTIAVDFDGVIHRYSHGWQDGSIYDDPMPGAFDALKTLMAQHAVFVHTSREPRQVADWLEARSGIRCAMDHGVKFWSRKDYLLVTNRKLPAIAYVDDRGIRFVSWDQALCDLEELVQ